MDPSKLLKILPGWLGFLLLIITGIILIVIGATQPGHPPRLFIGGAFAIAIGLFSWIVGGVSRVKDRVGTIGVAVEISDLPWWGWVVDVLLAVGMFVLVSVVK